MDILTRVLIERDKWNRDFTVLPNALYLGHDEYDQLRVALAPHCLYGSSVTTEHALCMTIYRVNAPSHFSIGVHHEHVDKRRPAAIRRTAPQAR